ncbi:MAG: hypothetical protein ACXVW6_07955 [Nocardioidaceae bacterium]
MSATTYKVVLPRPWVRVPIGPGTEARVHEIVEMVAREAPKELSPDELGPLKRQLERTLVERIREAGRNGGVDYYFPLGPMRGLHLGASFIVSVVMPPGGTTSAPGELTGMVLAELATREGAEAVAVGGTTWVRTESVVDPDPDRAPRVEVPTRRVSYTTALPGDPDRWVLVGFSCVGDGTPDGELTLVTVELFDAIMGTWRWSQDVPTAAGTGLPAG